MGDDVVDEVFSVVDAARKGDHDAWETLYRRVYPRLRAFVAGRIGATSVDDVVNETMTRAVASISRFDWEPSGFDAWIFGIARHVCLDEHRAAARRAKLPRRLFDPQAAVPAPGERLERVDDLERMRSLVRRLAPAEREVLELRITAGLSAEDTARILRSSPGAVRTAQSRALAHLRRLWDSDQ